MNYKLCNYCYKLYDSRDGHSCPEKYEYFRKTFMKQKIEIYPRITTSDRAEVKHE